MNESISYHKSMDFTHRKDFSIMFAKLPDNFRVLVDQIRISKCNGIVTQLTYNLTKWIISHVYGKGILYGINFSEIVLPILKNVCEDASVTSRTFGNKFYSYVRHVTVLTNGKIKKRNVRIDKSVCTSTLVDQCSKSTSHYMTEAVANIPMSRICILAKQSYIASRDNFLTSFCRRLRAELGVTLEMIEKTYVCDNGSKVRYQIQRQIIKAVMIQLRLRICAEGQRLGLLKIGENIPFSSKPRVLLKIGRTGMLIVPQGIGMSKMTCIDPVYYPLLREIEISLEQEQQKQVHA